MISRHLSVSGREPIDHESAETARVPSTDSNRPRENYFAQKVDDDLFLDPNLMDLDDKSKGEAENVEILAMINRAIENSIEKRLSSHSPYGLGIQEHIQNEIP